MTVTTSNRVFVDTSGWAYLADRHSQLHQPFRTVYNRLLRSQRRLVTTNYVNAELVPLVDSRARISRQQILSFVESLKASPHLDIVHVDPALDTAAWAFLKARRDKKWSVVDATSFVVMQRLGITEALTTDEHFNQAGFIRLP